ncbi:hypothetical protein CLOACE_16240 [Clostridium acetireducens DSM 10703]|uniref:Uncharacterized protein n=1 Tax=Clostridium acetireducens DSM 10703 TaxID=1121290 RepID=A0A1E8EXM4_9CLOT|nr:hypothetical protein [Clostridium acetireducens]OFI05541.1 hypothetical protein CLOACE_16240 [Clostridium acetireducens DSM 10703]
MLKKKNILFLSIILIIVLGFIGIHIKDKKCIANKAKDLSQTDILDIKEKMNIVISQSYEIMKTGKAVDYNNVVKNQKLLELLNKTNEFKVEWFKFIDIKIPSYKSELTIKKVQPSYDNTYFIACNYDVEFKIISSDVVSSAKDEYEFEVKKINGKFYITKMLDVQLDIREMDKKPHNNMKKDFSNYNKILDSQISSTDEILKNIDKYKKEFKEGKLGYNKKILK